MQSIQNPLWSRLVDEAFADLRAVGADTPVPSSIHWCFNVRMRPFGRYNRRWKRIEISDATVRGSETSLRNTIAHELIHACYPMDGHRGMFPVIAARMNARFPGRYDIHRLSTTNYILDIEEARKVYPYIVKCEACGRFWGHRRISRAVQHPEHFHCHCGGRLVRDK